MQNFFSKNRYFFLLIFIQLIFLWMSYGEMLYHPNSFLIQDRYDGLKDNFTFCSYVQDDKAANPFQYSKMDYPFGDYVYYIGNIPLLTIPLRLFCRHVVDVSAYSVGILNYFEFFNLVLCAILFFIFFKKIIRLQWLALAAATIITWTNPLLYRSCAGHYGLMLSSLFALYMLICFQLYEVISTSGFGKKFIFVALKMAALILLTAFTHLSYLPILFLGFGFFIGVCWLLNFRKIKTATVLMAVLILSAAAVGLILKTTDGYFNIRPQTSMGYDWFDYNFHFDVLFRYPYGDYKWLPIFYYSNRRIPYESVGYIGSAILVGFATTVIFLVVSFFQKRKLDFKKQTIFFLIAILLSAIPVLFISFGNQIVLLNEKPLMNNYFSLFYYLHNYVKAITHFRCLTRFSWLFFFAASVVIFYGLSLLFESKNKTWQTLVIICLLFGLHDVYQYTAMVNRSAMNKNTLTDFTDFKTQYAGINFSKFQAIICIPYFHAGSELVESTIDDVDVVSKTAFQFSLFTNLPLMDCKMSRTPPVFCDAQMHYFLTHQLHPDVKSKMTAQPVLLIYWKNIKINPPGKIAAQVAANFEPVFNAMDKKLIKQGEDFDLYEVNLK